MLDVVRQDEAEVVAIMRDARPWVKRPFAAHKRVAESAYLNRSLLMGDSKGAAVWRARVRAINALLEPDIEREVGYEVLRVD